MNLDPVFIGTATETFTPTQSGAIATVMHALARQSIEHGMHPTVIARQTGKAKPFEDVPYRFFDYPSTPDSGIMLKLRRAERKLRGWTRLRQGPWMRRVGDLLNEPEFQDRPWLIANEPELAVYLRRRFAHANIVCWFHNQLSAKPPARRTLAASCDQVWACSEFTGAWVAEHYGLSPADVHTLHNGVDVDRFQPVAPGTRHPYDYPIIQFVGRTGIEKAPDLLLAACLELADKTTAFSVRIVGSNHWDRYTQDAYQNKLKHLIDRLTQRGIAVEQTGHVDRHWLPSLMATADIHVTPSRWDEPFGLTTLEGMACGLATVAGDHGGSPEVLGDAGLRFKRDNRHDLAEVLQKLVLDPDLRADVAKRCHERAKTMTWRASYNRLTALLTRTQHHAKQADTAPRMQPDTAPTQTTAH